MSLPVLSLAVSGAAATAAASYLTERVFPQRRPRRATSSRLSRSSRSSRSPASSRSAVADAADGFFFFLVYGAIRASRETRPGQGQGSRGRSYSHGLDELLAATAAAACARLFSTALDGGGLFCSRRGSAAQDLAVALDPGLTFFLQEMFGQAVTRRRDARRQRRGTQPSTGFTRLVVDTTVAFSLAVASKAIATVVTHPLRRTEQPVEPSNGSNGSSGVTWPRTPTRSTTAPANGQITPTKTRSRSLSHVDLSGPSPPLSIASSPSSSLDNSMTNHFSHPPRPSPPPIPRRPAKFDISLPRMVLRAALHHGLTMAGQRVLYSVVLRLTYLVAGALSRVIDGRRQSEAAAAEAAKERERQRLAEQEEESESEASRKEKQATARLTPRQAQETRMLQEKTVYPDDPVARMMQQKPALKEAANRMKPLLQEPVPATTSREPPVVQVTPPPHESAYADERPMQTGRQREQPMVLEPRPPLEPELALHADRELVRVIPRDDFPPLAETTRQNTYLEAPPAQPTSIHQQLQQMQLMHHQAHQTHQGQQAPQLSTSMQQSSIPQIHVQPAPAEERAMVLHQSPPSHAADLMHEDRLPPPPPPPEDPIDPREPLPTTSVHLMQGSPKFLIPPPMPMPMQPMTMQIDGALYDDVDSQLDNYQTPSIYNMITRSQRFVG